MTSSSGNIFSVAGLCAGNSPVTAMKSPHKGQWRRTYVLSLICLNGRVNNGEAGDLSRHRAHYDVTVMTFVVCNTYTWGLDGLFYFVQVVSIWLLWGHQIVQLDNNQETLYIYISIPLAMLGVIIPQWKCWPYRNYGTKLSVIILNKLFCMHHDVIKSHLSYLIYLPWIRYDNYCYVT